MDGSTAQQPTTAQPPETPPLHSEGLEGPGRRALSGEQPADLSADQPPPISTPESETPSRPNSSPGTWDPHFSPKIWDRIFREAGLSLAADRQVREKSPQRSSQRRLGPEGITRWKEDLGGVLSLWRDPTGGKIYVVDGHVRHEAAEHLHVPSINSRFLDADTAEEARAIGAVINISQGRGTAIDVAKYLRDSGATPEILAAKGVSLGDDIARNGAALSGLAQDIFDQVVTGEIPQTWGIAMGDELRNDPDGQREALAAVKGSGIRLAEAEVREVARLVRANESEEAAQFTLLESEDERRSLLVPRAQVIVELKKLLAADPRLQRDMQALNLRRSESPGEPGSVDAPGT
jgi:hypothetical protein